MVDDVDREAPEGPPADPEEWSDEEWLAWLKATDPHRAERPVTTFGRLTHTTGGHLLGQAMVGLANAITGGQGDEVAIVAEGASEPGGDEPFRLHLDFEHPERSTAVFGPRRTDPRATEPGAPGEPGAPEEGDGEPDSGLSGSGRD